MCVNTHKHVNRPLKGPPRGWDVLRLCLSLSFILENPGAVPHLSGGRPVLELTERWVLQGWVGFVGCSGRSVEGLCALLSPRPGPAAAAPGTP